jgi:hypothetical protein
MPTSGTFLTYYLRSTKKLKEKGTNLLNMLLRYQLQICTGTGTAHNVQKNHKMTPINEKM